MEQLAAQPAEVLPIAAGLGAVPVSIAALTQALRVLPPGTANHRVTRQEVAALLEDSPHTDRVPPSGARLASRALGLARIQAEDRRRADRRLVDTHRADNLAPRRDVATAPGSAAPAWREPAHSREGHDRRLERRALPAC